MNRTTDRSYCQGNTDVPLEYWRTFDRLHIWAATTPNKEMIVFRRPDAPSRESVTYSEFHQLTDGIASHLVKSQSQLKVGTRVLLMGSNGIDFCAALAGLHKAGLVIVMVHPQSQRDLEKLTEKTNCAALFYQNSGIYQVASEWLKDRLEVRVAFDTLIELGKNTGNQQDQQDTNTLLSQRQAEISADQTAIMYFTSGTTGEPKLVPHSHHSLVNTIRFRALGALLTSDDIFFSDRPTGHAIGSFGFLMAMLGGLTLVATPYSTFSGDRGAKNAEWLLATLAEERVTSGDFFGYLVHDILQKGGRPPQTLRSALLTGSLTTQSQMERALKILPGLVNNYGSTETAAVTEVSSPWGKDENAKTRRETVGRPAPHMEVMIADREAKIPIMPLPLQTVGEIWVRGYSVMRGYFLEPELTRGVLTESGWFRTGDLGSMDEYGRVTVTGRIKDLIIRAADNIPPGGIERVLLEHPDVHAAQVFGIPDERLGEEIAACVIPRDIQNDKRLEDRMMARTLAKWCLDRGVGTGRNGLSNVPRYWAFLPEFPTSSSGKVSKIGVREFVISNGGFFDGVEFLSTGDL